jgi:hypothetical protein
MNPLILDNFLFKFQKSLLSQIKTILQLLLFLILDNYGILCFLYFRHNLWNFYIQVCSGIHFRTRNTLQISSFIFWLREYLCGSMLLFSFITWQLETFKKLYWSIGHITIHFIIKQDFGKSFSGLLQIFGFLICHCRYYI